MSDVAEKLATAIRKNIDGSRDIRGRWRLMRRSFVVVLVVITAAFGLQIVDNSTAEARNDGVVEIANIDYGGARLTASSQRNAGAFLSDASDRSSQWTLVPFNDEFFVIVNVGDGSYLHLKRDGTVNTTPVMRGTVRRYHWAIDDSGPITRIAPRNGTRFLDADDDGRIVDVNNSRVIDEGMAWSITPVDGFPAPDLVAEVPSAGGSAIQWIEALQVLDDDASEIVFTTRNQGANCGFGTPATAWKMTLDDSGISQSVMRKSTLSRIQTSRYWLFEASNGDLFTGGGWCGYKPPYFSTDRGESWQRADAGPVHPPNSTFAFGELNGEVYAGTGYSPHNGEIYKWLGGGNWEFKFDLGAVRSLVGAMVTFENQLFIGSSFIHPGDACLGTVSVYVTSDGDTYNPTTGIPDCYGVTDLEVVGGTIAAYVYDQLNRTQHYIYSWDPTSSSWAFASTYDFKSGRILTSDDSYLYTYEGRDVYRSNDFGVTWEHMGSVPCCDVTALATHGQTLYVGTKSDGNNSAWIYKWDG